MQSKNKVDMQGKRQHNAISDSILCVNTEQNRAIKKPILLSRHFNAVRRFDHDGE